MYIVIYSKNDREEKYKTKKQMIDQLRKVVRMHGRSVLNDIFVEFPNGDRWYSKDITL